MKNNFKVVAVILLTTVAVIVVLIATGIYTFNDSQDDTPSVEGDGTDTTQTETNTQINEHEQQLQDTAKNGTVVIEGESVALQDGMSSVPLPEFPDAETKIITEYIDIYYTGDFNGDTVADIAYIVAQNSGGSGTFYYVVAQLSAQGEYKNASNALFIGDRIRPQTIDASESGDLMIMYLDRAPDEALSATPTIETKREFTIYENSLQFVE